MTDLVPTAKESVIFPTLIFNAGESAQRRFLDFFLVTIRNPNTRAAYGYAVGAFFNWCYDKGVTLSQVTPMVVSAYIEQHPGSPLTLLIRPHRMRLMGLFSY